MLRFVSQIDTDPSTAHDPLYVMFHGYGNDESEMIRILDAVYRQDDRADVASQPTRRPNYLSFRGTVDRPYMGGSYWYPDGCGVDERRRACSTIGDAVVSLLDAGMFSNRRTILVGFSQGGYLSYRMVVEHPTLFDAAILLSPSFTGETDTILASDTRCFLAYGTEDRTIPPADQLTARRVLNTAGHLEYHEYAGMGHAICEQEISDIRMFVDR
ncbi:phospholipase [Bifidobacterium ramosum]|uniref:Phospholipase n=1 Tax=Bifidobacterium ramosum TaxID=1798158 RepID=A0A6L4X5H5_9BIFI|nr:dienelactone hydrolase family protein [Bifidobacterium ramosum]KAB8289467.1 phospholipase [Bifidobacterium ramosum]NEG71162.1 phospholipase [Bifidobacterium ramosum]